jgi:hypothetical protein
LNELEHDRDAWIDAAKKATQAATADLWRLLHDRKLGTAQSAPAVASGVLLNVLQRVQLFDPEAADAAVRMIAGELAEHFPAAIRMTDVPVHDAPQGRPN